jgi:hypothetical protein
MRMGANIYFTCLPKFISNLTLILRSHSGYMSQVTAAYNSGAACWMLFVEVSLCSTKGPNSL